jgi:regulatory protein
MADTDTDKALAACKKRALRILGIRSFSAMELTDRLADKGETPENAEKTVAWLLEIGLLDDTKYAESIARQYAQKGFGKRRITMELYRRGIDKELWDAALEELPEQDDKIDALLAKKLPPEPSRTDIKKSAEYLSRRGFSWAEIKSALERQSENGA